MPKKPFQVGDRVVYYDVEDAHDRTPHRTPGKILALLKGGRLQFEPEFDRGACWTVHEKACRRLVKRERRGVWIGMPWTCNQELRWEPPLKGTEHLFTEFVEVKRK